MSSLFGSLTRFWGASLGKIAGVSIKGWMLISAATTVAVAATGVGGTALYVHNQYQSSRLVVITINGLNTALNKCHYSGDTGASPQTFLTLQRALEQNGFYNPYGEGCPSSSPFPHGGRERKMVRSHPDAGNASASMLARIRSMGIA